MPCKSRLDWLSNDARLILDLKISELSSPAAWTRSIGSSGYDVQDAMYRRAVMMAREQEARFIFVVVDISTEGFPQVYFVTLDQTWREIGAQKLDKAMKQWKACLDADYYPGFEQMYVAEAPVWEFKDAEARGLEMEGWTPESFTFGRVKAK